MQTSLSLPLTWAFVTTVQIALFVFAVPYELLTLNSLPRIQPNLKKYIIFKGNSNSPCNLNAIFKYFFLFPLTALFL